MYKFKKNNKKKQKNILTLIREVSNKRIKINTFLFSYFVLAKFCSFLLMLSPIYVAVSDATTIAVADIVEVPDILETQC